MFHWAFYIYLIITAQLNGRQYLYGHRALGDWQLDENLVMNLFYENTACL